MYIKPGCYLLTSPGDFDNGNLFEIQTEGAVLNPLGYGGGTGKLPLDVRRQLLRHEIHPSTEQEKEFGQYLQQSILKAPNITSGTIYYNEGGRVILASNLELIEADGEHETVSRLQGGKYGGGRIVPYSCIEGIVIYTHRQLRG